MTFPVTRSVDAYRRTEVQSRTPLELVVMLYDGAMRFLVAAREAMDRRDIRARRDAISRVLAIIGELQNTLNMERGGEVADRLDRLYNYMSFRLLDATQHNDPKAVDEVHRLMTTLRDGWATISTQQTDQGNA